MELEKFSKTELKEYLVKLHKKVHWLLVYKEEESPTLSKYYDYVLFQLKGLHKMLSGDYRIMELYVLLESAKIESENPKYNHRIYRKAILDAHGIISELEKDYVDG